MDSALDKLLTPWVTEEVARENLYTLDAFSQSIFKAVISDIDGNLSSATTTWARAHRALFADERVTRIDDLFEKLSIPPVEWNVPTLDYEADVRDFVEKLHTAVLWFKQRRAFEKNFLYWAKRMKWDAHYARTQPSFWSLLFGFGGGSWSWALKCKERRLLEKSEYPMVDHPEIIRPFVVDHYYPGPYFSTEEKNIEFDRLLEEYKAVVEKMKTHERHNQSD